MTSYQSIQHRLALEQALPYTENWSAAADFLELIINHCLQAKPETIFECSSGLSTLVLARCCQINGTGHVYSLENGRPYAEQTELQLSELDLNRYSTIIHAPLVRTQVNNQNYDWYDAKYLPPDSIDMLVIDGPPGYIQKNSRYPAMPLLMSRLAEQSIIFLDDAARDDEKTIVDMWLEQYPEFEHCYIANERGCSVLTRKA